jgi:hypothetical protein
VANLKSGNKDRFAIPKSSSNKLGPGSYELPSHLRKEKPNRKHMMINATPRFSANRDGSFFFAKDETEASPGPGSYDYQLPYGNMLKPTYNVAIANQCRELRF